MKCDIIIPVWNQPETTRECIEALIGNTRYPYRLILIDNGSAAETRNYLEDLKKAGTPEVLLIRNEENLGYVKAVNQGLKASSAPYVCLMNNDTVPGDGWLERLVEFAEAHKEIGLMNPLCDGHAHNVKRTVDEYAREVAENAGRYMEMNQCFGFCTIIKREVIDKIGYLDEVFGVGGYDDTDYSMRAGKAGYFCASVHSAYVYHKQHVSFKALGVRDSATAKGRQEYLKKWPRHLRVGAAFFISDGTKDQYVEDMLSGVLAMARDWCWVNLWIYGDEARNKQRVDSAVRRIDMPLHQNIKFNFMPDRFSAAQTLVRLIERSFGTKRRKKYDAVFVNNDGIGRLLKTFYRIHTAKIIPVKPGMAYKDEIALLR
ncbi:MAG: glycosyltransferase family 2 protein [Candidatus Omnitrophica bacterium]|nr:glycosyltransferase family 2 protein [Candidatus Omnitrophota bacterium]